MKTPKKILLVCGLVVCLGIVLCVFAAFQLQKRYTEQEPSLLTNLRVVVKPRSLFPQRDSLNVLILGTDYKDVADKSNVRSDVMFLARMDLQSQKLKLLSIPKDTRVEIPGKNERDPINMAFTLGGAKLSETVVQNLLGVPIDNYVRIKEEDLNNLVDAVGGIDINIEKNVDNVDPTSHAKVHFEKGYQHLDGEKAAQYFRFRGSKTGDSGRIERQEKVLKAIRRRFTDPSVLADLSKVVMVALKNVETDMKLQQLFALANLFKGTQMSSVAMTTLKR